MTWAWATDTPVEDADLAADLAAGWPTQEDAETWLREWYEALADAGVQTVTLLDDDTPAYTMSLAEEPA